MGWKYPVLPPNKIIKVMSKFGFEKRSQECSHVYSEIAKETLNSILE